MRFAYCALLAGRAFGGLTAYVVGIITGDQALANTALEGMADNRDNNLEALVVLGTVGRARASGEACRLPNNVKASKGTDFIVSSNGAVFPVPKGASGPIPVVNASGTQTGVAYTGGAGGSNGQVDTMRIMNPTPPRGASPAYPNGYIKYENSSGQGVDPYTGRTLPNSQSHFPLN